MKRTIQALGLTAALLAALLLGGCTGGEGASSAAPGPAATAEPTPTPQAEPVPNPLTGLADADYTGRRPGGRDAAHPVRRGRPQWGRRPPPTCWWRGVTEGTTASLMALYANVDAISKAGPVGPGRDLLLQFALPLNAPARDTSTRTSTPPTCSTPWATRTWTATTSARAAFAFDQDRQNAGYREEKLLVHHRRPDPRRPGTVRRLAGRGEHAAVPVRGARPRGRGTPATPPA